MRNPLGSALESGLVRFTSERPRFAHTDITAIIRTRALHTATMERIGSRAEYSLARDPGSMASMGARASTVAPGITPIRGFMAVQPIGAALSPTHRRPAIPAAQPVAGSTVVTPMEALHMRLSRQVDSISDSTLDGRQYALPAVSLAATGAGITAASLPCHGGVKRCSADLQVSTIQIDRHADLKGRRYETRDAAVRARNGVPKGTMAFHLPRPANRK